MLGKHTLKPGEKTALKVVFDTAGNPGPFRKTATLTTDVPGQEEVEVAVTGMVREAPAAKIRVEPRRIRPVPAGSQGGMKGEFTIFNNGSLPLVIGRVHSKESARVYFDSKKEGSIVVEPGGARKIEIVLGEDKQADRAGQELVAIESNARNAPQTGYVIIIEHGDPSKK